MELTLSDRRTLLIWFVAVAVAVAFADSSIVVLALPELYGRFDTTIEGVSWVVTAYNAAVALVALALVFVVHRWRAAHVLAGGLVIFIVASLVCASSGSLELLIAAPCRRAADPGRVDRLGRSRQCHLDGRRHVRRRARAGTRRCGDAGVRLAGDLRGASD